MGILKLSLMHKLIATKRFAVLRAARAVKLVPDNQAEVALKQLQLLSYPGIPIPAPVNPFGKAIPGIITYKNKSGY